MDEILEKSDENRFANGQSLRDLRVSPELRNNRCGWTGEPAEIPIASYQYNKARVSRSIF